MTPTSYQNNVLQILSHPRFLQPCGQNKTTLFLTHARTHTRIHPPPPPSPLHIHTHHDILCCILVPLIGQIYIHWQVEDPNGAVVHETNAKAEGQFAFTAKVPGEYKACFSVKGVLTSGLD